MVFSELCTRWIEPKLRSCHLRRCPSKPRCLSSFVSHLLVEKKETVSRVFGITFVLPSWKRDLSSTACESRLTSFEPDTPPPPHPGGLRAGAEHVCTCLLSAARLVSFRGLRLFDPQMPPSWSVQICPWGRHVSPGTCAPLCQVPRRGLWTVRGRRPAGSPVGPPVG